MEIVCDYSINLQHRATRRMTVPNARCRNCVATWPLLSLPTRLVLRGQELYARLVVAGSANIRYYGCIWVTAGRIQIECMFAPKRQTTALVPQHSPNKCHHELAQEKKSHWARPTRLLPPLRQGIPSSDTSTSASSRGEKQHLAGEKKPYVIKRRYPFSIIYCRLPTLKVAGHAVTKLPCIAARTTALCQ